MEQLLNKNQLSCICALMHKLKIIGQPVEEMVSGFSGGRTVSRAKLYSAEANALIRHLKELDPEERGAELMRRKIISLAHEMGWRELVVKDGQRMVKADMKRIDGWCMNYGYLKKKLNQYLYSELPQLVTQFEAVYKSYLKGF